MFVTLDDLFVISILNHAVIVPLVWQTKINLLNIIHFPMFFSS